MVKTRENIPYLMYKSSSKFLKMSEVIFNDLKIFYGQESRILIRAEERIKLSFAFCKCLYMHIHMEIKKYRVKAKLKVSNLFIVLLLIIKQNFESLERLVNFTNKKINIFAYSSEPKTSCVCL